VGDAIHRGRPSAVLIREVKLMKDVKDMKVFFMTFTPFMPYMPFMIISWARC
jgi:hypothetical protein